MINRCAELHFNGLSLLPLYHAGAIPRARHILV